LMLIPSLGILLSILAPAVLGVESSQSAKSFACDFIERYEVCPDTIEPVCSVYPGICNAFSCSPQEYANSCYACQDPTVSAYSIGPCPTTPIEGELEGISEEEAFFGEETELIGEDDWLGLPLRDSFYVIVFCDEQRPTNCTLDYNPVCIVECLNGTCTKTAQNACTACADPTVISYSLERCEKEKLYCDDAQAFVLEEESCISLYDPVCAHYPNCTGANCAVTVTNSCQACLINQAEYFTIGPC